MVLTNRIQFLVSIAIVSCFVYICVSFGVYYTGNIRNSLTIYNSVSDSSKATVTDCICRKANISEDEPLDRFCVVITVFSRTDLVLQLLKHYSKLPRLSRIIIVWNNKNITPPLQEWDKLGPHSVPVHFKVQERNSLMNKLQLFSEIDTPGVLLVDDDQLVSQADVEFAFDVWKQVPHLIVGWYPRLHKQNHDGTYKYLYESFTPYSMMLTGAAFVHKEYMRMFRSEEVPDSARKLVDSLKNCEDILFNMMVAIYLKKFGKPQCPGLYIHAIDLKDLQKTSKNQDRGLSVHGGHIEERNLCLNRFAEIYGEMPLMNSFIAAMEFSRSLKIPSGVRMVEHM